jgi:hypothetical protein
VDQAQTHRIIVPLSLRVWTTVPNLFAHPMKHWFELVVPSTSKKTAKAAHLISFPFDARTSEKLPSSAAKLPYLFESIGLF